ncbi:MAG: ABC transporter substrate-binding protein [Treponema sp.]|jgi:raffinose/stachyose/melibiose transport system substrate-binding protein|nr:ABC transporter substrate-binding protein [Treponema sp.]
MKKSILFVLAVLAAFAMTACGKGKDSAAAAPGGKRTIRFLCSSTESETWVGGLRAMAAKFAESHPGFGIEIEIANDQAARSQKIKILSASDEYYDWFSTDRDPFMQGLAQKGDVVNVKQLLTELGKEDALYDIAYKFNAFDDGSLYFFSFVSVMEYFWFHPSQFEKAGIKKSDIVTFDDFAAALKKLKAAGLQPLAFCNAEWYVQRYDAFIPFRLTGNNFIDQLKYNKINMNSEVGLAAANWLKEISPYLSEGWAADDHNAMLESFLAGNSAICYYGTWDPTNFITRDGALKNDIDYFMLPVLGGGRDKNLPTDAWCNSGTGVAFATKHMDDTNKAFIKFILEEMPQNAVDHLYLPSVKPTDAQVASFPKGFQTILSDILAVQDFGTCWDINVDPATYEALGKGTVNLMLGEITPAQFCDNVDAAIDNNAEKYWSAAGGGS